MITDGQTDIPDTECLRRLIVGEDMKSAVTSALGCAVANVHSIILIIHPTDL